MGVLWEEVSAVSRMRMGWGEFVGLCEVGVKGGDCVVWSGCQV